MKDSIKLGYEIGTGKEVSIQPSHLLVTGQSQKAGKTTTLETLTKRWGKKAVVFRTKVGEKSFLAGTIIPPYFKDRSDWKFIKGLVESTMKMRIDKFEQATIIQLCKQTGGNSLIDFKKKVDQKLTEKISNSTTVTLTNLQAYLEEVLPKLTTIQFSQKLELVEGLNIIDLERFARDSEVQSLIIASVLEEVLYNQKDTVVIVPEAWKFIPQERGNPCKLAVVEFIRQGATNHNYLWIDSQDMSGVDKEPLKQISEWILGYQAEKNEVKHTLDQIPLPKLNKPKEDDVMTLGKGIFYFASRDMTKKVYIQPFWLDDDEKAIKIAKGELKVEDLDVTITQAKNEVKAFEAPKPVEKLNDPIKDELNEMRIDFFSKLADMQTQVSIISQNMHDLQNKNVTIDEVSIVAKVLQKIPIQTPTIGQSVNKEEIINEVLKRVPKGGSVVYTVSPLEKIRKDFIIDAKNKLLDDIGKMSEKAKQMMKYMESRGGVGVPVNEICVKCFLMKSGGGGYSKQVNDYGNELSEVLLAKKQTNGNWKPDLKDRIIELIKVHGATDQEIDQLYDHIMFELLTPQSKGQISI